MITAPPLQPRTAAGSEAPSATDAEEVSLLVRYRELEDEEFFALTRHDFAAANRALSSRLEIKALLLANQVSL